ncbi:MAG TPA: DUF4129 domain-containing protein [Clostridiaceae bacterium]|nr:DUF4129 domain-containing protein [Clostridiaceae bacterium]
MAYILLISCIWLFISPENSRYLIIYLAGTAIFFIRGIAKATGGSVIFFYAGGLVIHGISLFFLSRVSVINPYFNIAVTASVIYVAISLPLANWYFLITESQQKNSLNIMPETLVRGNRMIAFGMLGIIGVLSSGRFLLQGFDLLLRTLRDMVGWLMSLLASDDDFSVPPPENFDPSFEEMPQAESSPLVELISDIISALLTLTVLFFVIRYIVKNHKMIIRSIMDFLSRLMNRFHRWSSSEQSYVDTQEFLLKLDDLKGSSFFKRFFRREKRWKDMKDNASRTRFIYTRFVLDNIKRGFRFKVSDTPSETVRRISGEMKSSNENHSLLDEAYNSVRYGQKEVSDETVRALKDQYL